MSFTITEPSTVTDAVRLIAADDETRIVAGGTGLTLLLRYGLLAPTRLVSLRNLPSLAGVARTGDGGLRIGAATTLSALEHSDDVAARAPALRQALRRLGNVRVRNVAQLGGAVAHGHPQMDLPPVLVAGEARIEVTGPAGTRQIPAGELFLGYYDTAIGDDELVTAVHLPPHHGVYRKVTLRTAEDWPALGVAVTTDPGDSRDGPPATAGVRIAVGAIGDRPFRLTDLEDALADTPPTPAGIADAVTTAVADLEIHDGVDASAEYRRHLVAVHVRRALQTVLLDGADPDHGDPDHGEPDHGEPDDSDVAGPDVAGPDGGPR